MFKGEIQMVGTEGAKMLCELGNKVEKLEKLSPDVNLLEKVHEAAKELQMMIDQKSHHLVNSDKWAARRQPKDFAKADCLLEPHISTLSNHPSLVHWDSSEHMLKQQTHWPSRLSVLDETIINVGEVKIYESASALSLATFTSLLIEFVARLQNLVSAFEELSEKANFGVSGSSVIVFVFVSNVRVD